MIKLPPQDPPAIACGCPRAASALFMVYTDGTTGRVCRAHAHLADSGDVVAVTTA